MVLQRVMALSLMIFAGSSMGASFDCGKASTYAEKEVCRDGYLSGLDNILASNLKTAMSMTDEQGVLRQTQIEWLNIRDQCRDQKCLDQAYSGRIKALENFTQSEKTKSLRLAEEKRKAAYQAEEVERVRQIDESRRAQEQARQTSLQAAQQKASNYQQSSSVNIAPATENQTTKSVTSQLQSSMLVKQQSDWGPVFGVVWKVILLLAIVASLVAVKRHRQRVATIYNNYTDALITNLLPVSGWFIGLICGWLGMPHQVYQATTLVGIFSAVLFATYSAFKCNRNGLDILLTVIAKLFFISIFYIIIGFLLISLVGTARRNGESLTQAEARQRRQARESKFAIAATSAGYTFFTAWLCRRPEFTSISECLDFDIETSVV